MRVLLTNYNNQARSCSASQKLKYAVKYSKIYGRINLFHHLRSGTYVATYLSADVRATKPEMAMEGRCEKDGIRKKCRTKSIKYE